MDPDPFIDECVNHCFRNKKIRPQSLKHTTDINLPEWCVLINIDGKKIQVLKEHPQVHQSRLKIFLSFLRKVIWKNNISLHIRLILNTGDQDQASTFPIFQFSRENTSLTSIVIPDAHLVSSYLGLRGNDLQRFENKIPKIIFRGSDTGAYPDAVSNERIYFCNAFKNHVQYDFKISKFFRHTEENLKKYDYDLNEIRGNYLSLEEQARYQYIADINGNTIAWDRNFWALPLNSILIKFQKKESPAYETWYSDYMYRNRIVPVFNENNSLSELMGREGEIIKKQKEFSKLLLSKKVNQKYFKRILYRYDEMYHSKMN